MPTTWSDDAGFRTVAKAFSDVLKAAGFVHRSGNTGQIDFTTVSKPAAANAIAGNEMFSLYGEDDTEYTIKIGYGSGTLATCLAVTVSFGSGHDGAVTLLGYTTVVRLYSAYDQVDLYASSGDGFCAFMFGGATALGQMLCYFERVMEPNGEHADRAAICGVCSGTGSGHCLVRPGLTATLWMPGVGLSFPQLLAYSTVGEADIFSPIPLFTHTPRLNAPQLGMIGIYSGDSSVGSTFTFDIYGGTHTYISAGSWCRSSAPALSIGQSTNLSFNMYGTVGFPNPGPSCAFLWE